MAERSIHIIALLCISVGSIAKILAALISRSVNPNVRLAEFFSIAVYFLYIGWLGFYRREGATYLARYMGLATALVTVDIILYYFLKGWA